MQGMYYRGINIKKPNYNDQTKQEGKNKKRSVKLNIIQEESSTNSFYS